MPDSASSRNRMKQDHLRKEFQEKYERSLFTPAGLKIIRLQPTINNEALHKYQPRSASSSASSFTSPKRTSTPLTNGRGSPTTPRGRPPSVARSQDDRPQSATSLTSTSLEQAASTGQVREKAPEPSQFQRPGSSLRSHSATFNTRSSSCRPAHMFRNEDLRSAAKLNRPPSHVYQCDERHDRSRSAPRAQSPRRFDGTPVQLPDFVKDNEFLRHSELSLGQKQYIWGIARIYSTSHLMQLKQRQYQNLLDYEFSRRIQNKELKEHERAKEIKDYMRYTRFIKRYEQRIPRSCKPHAERSPCEDAAHIHKHVIKGWTTDPRAHYGFRAARQQSADSVAVDAAAWRNEKSPRRHRADHVHRHVVKGWTTDADADQSCRPASRLGGERRDSQGVADPTSDSGPEEFDVRVTLLPGDGLESNAGEAVGDRSENSEGETVQELDCEVPEKLNSGGQPESEDVRGGNYL